MFYPVLVEVQSLLSFLDDVGDVIIPFEFMADVGSEKFFFFCQIYFIANIPKYYIHFHTRICNFPLQQNTKK